MNRQPTLLCMFVASALLGLSCASAPAPAPESGGAATTASAGAGAAPATGAAPAAPAAPPKLANLPGMTKTWNDLDAGERKEYMKTRVMPRMSDEFAGFDAKYAEFTCVTCHGSSAKKGNFKMPNAELPKLPKDPEAMKKLAAEKPAVAMFMSDMVKPHMADLLGKKPFDPKTKTGMFGCTACHTLQ
ncbi:MAG TPA: hypothetical protein VNO55_15565 [Polyangia bacterium]|nr:hypothetical protein [Polyangia bacterium]